MNNLLQNKSFVFSSVVLILALVIGGTLWFVASSKTAKPEASSVSVTPTLTPTLTPKVASPTGTLTPTQAPNLPTKTPTPTTKIIFFPVATNTPTPTPKPQVKITPFQQQYNY